MIEIKERLSENIFLIAHYRNKRDLYVIYKQLKMKGLSGIEMFFLEENGLNIPIEKINTPFYFNINSNLIMNNFFIPQKDKPELSESYLKFVLKNFIE